MSTVRSACYGLDTESTIVSVVDRSGLERARTLCGPHFSLADVECQIAGMEDGPDRNILKSIAFIIKTAQQALLDDTGSMPTPGASSASTQCPPRHHSP